MLQIYLGPIRHQKHWLSYHRTMHLDLETPHRVCWTKDTMTTILQPFQKLCLPSLLLTNCCKLSSLLNKSNRCPPDSVLLIYPLLIYSLCNKLVMSLHQASLTCLPSGKKKLACTPGWTCSLASKLKKFNVGSKNSQSPTIDAS